MSITLNPVIQRPLEFPQIPALYANAKEAFLLDHDGEIHRISHARAGQMIGTNPVLVCHAPYTCKRLGLKDLFAFDLLELFAFVHPATFCVPTPVGLARALGVTLPKTPEDYPASMMNIMMALLSDVRQDAWKGRADPLKIAAVMGQNGKGWVWTPFIFSALGQTYNEHDPIFSKVDLNIWKHLPEWTEIAPPPPAAHHPITGEQAREKLRAILKETMRHDGEDRTAQMAYTSSVTAMFRPKDNADMPPQGVLLEAGTGVGKTLGYLAPASVWADQNKGSVWISTYTKNLQRQIHQELTRLFPDPDVKDVKVAVRKGRENYLCLLNLEDFTASAALARHPRTAIAAGLMARWAAATRDGDLSGQDFPGWLAGLLGVQNTLGLADRRGECIYSACDHYHRCFIEQSVRKSRHADLVVANHAVVMIQTAISSQDSDLPRHYIFDEGHHLFDAADSAYGAHLTALETYELRRWIRGNEGGQKSRMRGLKRRAEDLVLGDEKLEKLLQSIIECSRCLTSEGWAQRLKDKTPKDVCEQFLLAVYDQIYARADGRDGPYSLETQTYPATPDVLAHAQKLKSALQSLEKPMVDLANGLRKKLNDQVDTLSSDDRKRLDAMIISVTQKARTVLSWGGMLDTLINASPTPSSPSPYIDWMEIDRHDGRAIDVGLYRHYIDPMIPFAQSLAPHAHGVTVTSATLRDTTEDEGENWRVAQSVSGMRNLTPFVLQEKFESPFDYPIRTKVFIINDVRKDDLDQVSGAYRVLFESSGGGALGLFTAISRLRAVHDGIASKLEERGLHLYAQHVDAMDNGTLVDIFRDDVNACLLGTDAVRDGVDVPGESLRLIVFDRVPWPRPTILHKARREAFGGKDYDDRITRLKLKQAFGRLIRRKDDKGVFVMLDPMLPSRLHGAFPAGVEIIKCGLTDATAQIKAFLQTH